MTRSRSRSLVAALAVLVAGIPAVSACNGSAAVAGAGASSSAPAAVTSAGAESAASAPAAGDVLAKLAVRGRAPMTGYDRDLYGDGWADADRDGCSTREEILERDLTRKAFKSSGRCQVVTGGVLADPYSGRSITFTRGATSSAQVQIDHVVALADSWQKGAQRWTAAQRLAFANDPMNLLAVDGKLNQAKGAGDAATWLPPNRGYRCAYVARQVAVKARYGVWVTAAERDAAARVLAGCPGQRVPVS